MLRERSGENTVYEVRESTKKQLEKRNRQNNSKTVLQNSVRNELLLLV